MKTENVREHFRVQVPDYLGLMRRLIPFYDEQRDLMLALIPFERGASLRVLDLGCGPGLMATAILAEFPHARLTLVDLTTEMIDACRSRLGGSDRITYQVGDFRTDDFGNGYDVLLASLSLHHLTVPERPAFYRRGFRSLAPGGHLIAAEVIVDESCLVSEASREGSSGRGLRIGYDALRSGLCVGWLLLAVSELRDRQWVPGLCNREDR